nr:hypothetical protein Iba_chr01cCG11870 [Ipomoea batatas]GMC55808.1 hypothetical protein Iba_chr01fCG1170 [Ipomoea batatas]
MLAYLLNKMQLLKDMLHKCFRKSMKLLWLPSQRWKEGWLWLNQCWKQPCSTNLVKTKCNHPHDLHSKNLIKIPHKRYQQEKSACYLDGGTGISRGSLAQRSLVKISP